MNEALLGYHLLACGFATVIPVKNLYATLGLPLRAQLQANFQALLRHVLCQGLS
jgi:hypothetical protein